MNQAMMSKAVLWSGVVIAGLVLAPYTMAQAPEPQQEMQFEGALVSVDLDASTLTSENAAGERMTFQYTAETEVVGPVDDVQGLSGQPGTLLRITYQSEGEASMATRIEVTASLEP
jgi:hypothetical protein